MIIERLRTERGELVLRASGPHFEIISNGIFLMDTRGGGSERLLVRVALAGAPPAARVLIGGLGVGFSLAEAVASARVGQVVVVEVEPAVLRWGRGRLPAAGPLADPRVRAECAELAGWLRGDVGRFDAICLDVDNGPDWTVTDGNASLYRPAGLAALAGRLAPGGTLTVWSAAPSPAFEDALAARFSTVRRHEVAAPRGGPDVVYAARGPVSPAGGR